MQSDSSPCKVTHLQTKGLTSRLSDSPSDGDLSSCRVTHYQICKQSDSPANTVTPLQTERLASRHSDSPPDTATHLQTQRLTSRQWLISMQSDSSPYKVSPANRVAHLQKSNPPPDRVSHLQTEPLTSRHPLTSRQSVTCKQFQAKIQTE